MYKVKLSGTWTKTTFSFAEYADVVSFVSHAVRSGRTDEGDPVEATISFFPDERGLDDGE